ncbi:MAG TPA: glutamine--fructose-6-phosphate transaminase (isomerizing) [Anaerolineales bacterium]|nr:glutamine--fructose-6-phosphate transaminase (isomerizing) [Anaerolineales bacterium]
MCGIVGYIGDQDATPIIINGLKKLEYRGYDSAGIAVINNGNFLIERSPGKLINLEKVLGNGSFSGSPGIGHTRWATHGAPSIENAHPHISNDRQIAIVHNGIVENYLEIKELLLSKKVNFKSETDTETIVHLVEENLNQGLDFVKAARKTFNQLRGASSIVLISNSEPDKIVCARLGNAGGIVIGLGKGENFISSDIPAILEHTREMVFLEAGQMAIVTRHSFRLETFSGEQIQPKINQIAYDPIAAEKGEFRHFMQKEIHEQVRSITDTLSGRVDFQKGKIYLNDLNIDDSRVRATDRIYITACGTAAYAGMVGKTLIEKIARIPVEVVIGSEFRYSDPIIDDKTIVLAITQSGETADTLAAMEEGRRKGALVWSIVNAIGSQAMRIADGFVSMQTGPEIGVASTKAFTAPLVDLYLLAIVLGEIRGTLSETDRISLVQDLRLLPDLVDLTLQSEPAIEVLANKYKDMRDCLYLGRGINMPIAYEGALKLKEISYIHAEGYPAGEMKHGPIALIDENMPVICITPNDPWREKMVSQIQQAKARKAKVIAVATMGDELVSSMSDDVMWIPNTPWMLSPVISVLPLQLFAYHIATSRGLDVDQPRNLAKSVTVE